MKVDGKYVSRDIELMPLRLEDPKVRDCPVFETTPHPPRELETTPA